MSDELKPCPFCGQSADFSVITIPGFGDGPDEVVTFYGVTCDDNCCELKANFRTKSQALKSWNGCDALHDITHDIPAAMQAIADALNALSGAGIMIDDQRMELHAELMRLSALIVPKESNG